MKNIESLNIDSEMGPLSTLASKNNLKSLSSLLEYVKKLPYGRSSDRRDFSSVLVNRKGTCSSKHALIKLIAVENDWDELELLLVMYKMNPINTPGVQRVFDQMNLNYIPEAHCVLRYDDEIIDVTNVHSDFNNIASYVLQIENIEPAMVVDKKVDYHKSYIKQWLEAQKLPYTFEQVWAWRETCILCLSQ